MFLGCDKKEADLQSFRVNRFNLTVGENWAESSNPGIFTDGRCYLDWILDQYGYNPPKTFAKHCNPQSGLRTDKNKDSCFAYVDENTDPIKCNFTGISPGIGVLDQCILSSVEGYSINEYQCVATDGRSHPCANNCKGVEANNIVVGGVPAAVVASTVGGGLLAPLGVVGAGIIAVNGMCAPGFCRPRNFDICCQMVIPTTGRYRGRLACPRSC